MVLGGIADEFGAEGGCHLGTEEMLSLTDQQEPYRRFLEQPRGQLAGVLLSQRTADTCRKRLPLSSGIDWATELERRNLWNLQTA